MNYLIGVDAGTTSFKAVLCSTKGEEIAVARQEYSLITVGDTVEFDPEKYWEIFCGVVKDLFAETDVSGNDVVSVAISSQGETLICVDEKGRSLGNAIVWLDKRATQECDLLKSRFTPEEIYEHTGQCEIEPNWTAAKIMWIKKHEPERFANTNKFLLLEDYLLYRLTGKFVCEKVLLASTLLYDIPNGSWWKDMVDFIGLSEDKLPTIMESANLVGKLQEEAAVCTSLSPDTAAVTGALDQVAAMVGSGNIKPGKVTAVTGSCLVVETVTESFPDYNEHRPITCQPFCLHDRYLLLMFSNTAGMAFKWFRDCFYPDGTVDYGELADEAGKISLGADGLIMLPHLAGAQFPLFNPDAKGVFWGATLAHERGHFVRAIFESVAYLERSMLEMLEQSGYKIHDITALGGGAGNLMWNDIKANVINQCISTTQVKEPASLGAAILAGVGSGVFSSLEEGCMIFSRQGDCFYPDKESSAIYEEKYKAFLRLNKAFEDIGKNNLK